MYDCLLRHLWIELDFSDDFTMWCVIQNLRNDFPNDYLCNGWEL